MFAITKRCDGEAARDGEYVPTWRDVTNKTPDAHEESEELFYFADCKLREIVALLGENIKDAGLG
jgi:hypothetical protein